MRRTGASVAGFLAGVPDERRREDARRLCAMMQEVTGEPPAMWGTSIVGFGSYHYRYASGREGDSPLASFAPRGQRLVIYLVGEFAERHQSVLARLGPHQTGKGCLYLKRLDDVDQGALRELIDRSARVRKGTGRASAGPGQPAGAPIRRLPEGLAAGSPRPAAGRWAGGVDPAESAGIPSLSSAIVRNRMQVAAVIGHLAARACR